jgi:hypothetical protein
MSKNPMPANPRPGPVTTNPHSPVGPVPVVPLPSPMQTPERPLYPPMPGSPVSPNVRRLT